jgi:hypothetical protein
MVVEDRGQPLARLIEKAGYRRQCRNHSFGVSGVPKPQRKHHRRAGLQKAPRVCLARRGQKKGVVSGGWPKRGLMRKLTRGLSGMTNTPPGRHLDQDDYQPRTSGASDWI